MDRLGKGEKKFQTPKQGKRFGLVLWTVEEGASARLRVASLCGRHTAAAGGHARGTSYSLGQE